LHGGRKTRRNSYIFWGAAFIIWLAAELLGLFRRHSAALRRVAPQWTLSETVWALFRALPAPVRYAAKGALWAFLGLLAAHLTMGTSLFPGLGH